MRIHVFAVVAILSCFPFFASAQGVGDYRTRAGGDWTDPNTWDRFNGTSWVVAPSAPTSTAGVISVQAAHNVVVPASVTVTADQVVVDGTVTVAQNGVFVLLNGPGTDLAIAGGSLAVNGTFIRGNLSEVVNTPGAAALLFNNGSLYEHRFSTSFGDMPAATWHPNSTLLFSRFQNTSSITANATWDQEYGHVTFNSPNLRGFLDFRGNLKTVQGNLSLLNNGSYPVRFSILEDLDLSVGGNVTVNGSSRIIFGVYSPVQVTIQGNFVFTSNNQAGSYGTVVGTTTIDLGGDFIVNSGSGRFRFAGEGSTGNTTLNLLNGNFNLISGGVEERGSGAAHGNIRFLRAGEQTFRNTGSISGFFNYYVSPSTTLDVGNYGVVGSVPSTFVLDGGTLVLGSTHTAGAITLGTSVGNIRTPLNGRTYNPGSTLIYRGAAAQYIASGHPAVTGITTVIDNPAGVNLSENVTMEHPLVLTSGTLHIQNHILTLNSTISTTGGTLGGNQNSQLAISGNLDGSVGILPFAPAASMLGTLEVNRSGTNVDVTVGQPLTVHTQVNLVRGTLVNNSTLTLRDGLVLSRFETAGFTGNRPTTLEGELYDVTYRTLTPVGGPYAVMNTGSELPDNDFRLGNLVINLAQTADRVQLSHYTTVNRNVNLERGLLAPENFGLTMNGPNWNDNTGNLVPGGGVVIFNGATTIDGTSNPLFGNIQVNAAASVDFVRDFSIQGNVSFLPGSTVQMNDITVTFSGSNPQNVSANGASFPNINVSKSSGQGILLLSRLNLTGLLYFSTPSANVNVQSNGHLHLISTSDAAGSGTARIYRLLEGNRVSGDVVAYRFMSAEGRVWRYISSPITNATVAQLKDDFSIGGNFVDPSPKETICGMIANPNAETFFYYDETEPGTIDDGYVPYPNPGTSSAASPLQVGRGYAAFIRECDEPVVIDYTGPVNQGTLTLPVTFTSYGGNPGDGWNLVGNPYPGTIDWDAGWTKTRISPLIAIRDYAADVYRYYQAGVTDEIPNGRIAMGQSFWVRATGANPLLRITENAKVGPAVEFFREAAPQIPNFVVALSDGKREDYAYVMTVADAALHLDEFDGPKMKNPDFGLSTLTPDDVSMAINAVNELSCGMELPLKTDGLVSGSYSFRIDTRSYFSEFSFVLNDRYTNREIRLGGTAYNFDVTDSASARHDRFVLRVEDRTAYSPVAIVSSEGCTDDISVALSGTENNVEYSIWTVSGQRMSALQAATSGTLNISFSADSLSIPEELIVKAHSACGSALVVSEPFTFASNATNLTLTTRADCQTGNVQLVGAADHSDVVINWYESEHDINPVFTGSVFDVGALKKTKTYFAEAVSRTGCAGPRQAVRTEVTPVTAPTVTVAGDKLVSNYDTDNQWYYEGELIAENCSSVPITKTGAYTLHVNVSGCLTTVQHFQEELPGLTFYPNPVSDKLMIGGITDDVEEIQLVNTLGVPAAVIYRKGEQFVGQADVQFLADGVYLLVVTKAKEKRSYRIIKETK